MVFGTLLTKKIWIIKELFGFYGDEERTVKKGKVDVWNFQIGSTYEYFIYGAGVQWSFFIKYSF